MSCFDDPTWIAEFDQQRAHVDECLDGLLKAAQSDSRGPTETFVAVMGCVSGLGPDVQAAFIAAAVTRLAAQEPQK